MTKSLSSSQLSALREHDTPTICNAIELFNVRPRNIGYTDTRIQACFPEMPPMVGYATTATFRAGSAPAEGADTPLHEQVAAFSDIPGPPVVVFQDLDSPSAAASFGDMMCSTYKAFGAVGLITSGAARDLDQVRALGFPAFSDGTICSHGYRHTLDLHIPVQVGGITISPGDLLHGDANGVSTIPSEIADELSDACSEYAAAEGIVLDYLQSGGTHPSELASARAEYADRIEALRTRVTR